MTPRYNQGTRNTWDREDGLQQQKTLLSANREPTASHVPLLLVATSSRKMEREIQRSNSVMPSCPPGPTSVRNELLVEVEYQEFNTKAVLRAKGRRGVPVSL